MKHVILEYLILIFWTMLIFQSKTEDAPESLYQGNHNVIELHEKNFPPMVFGQRNDKAAHFTEFYAHWCGHCQKFALTWKSLAEVTKNWRKVVRIVSFNCAEAAQQVFCSKAGVPGYPAVRYYPPTATEFTHAYNVTHTNSLVNMKQKLINLILEDYHYNRHKHWPNFDYMPNIGRLDEMWEMLKPIEFAHLALVFEDESDNFTAAEIMLDLSTYNWLHTRRVKSSNGLASIFNIDAVPSLIILLKNEMTPIYTLDFRSLVLKELHQIFGGEAVMKFDPTTMNTLQTTPVSVDIKLRYILSETDLMLATRYSLFEALMVMPVLNGSKLTALQDFVLLLSLHYPPLPDSARNYLSQYGYNFPNLDRSRRVKLLLKDLYQHLVSNANVSITNEQWANVFTALEEKHGQPFPKNVSYVHCKGSKVQYRGYPCGMWTLFHTLTIHAFYEKGHKYGFDPFWILNSIMRYMDEFFACRECASHFVDMLTNTFDMHVYIRNNADLIYYLWNAHNIVNNRLKGEPSEDPLMPKVQFPPDFMCLDCRNASSGEFRQTVILHFLTNYYGVNISPHAAVDLSYILKTLPIAFPSSESLQFLCNVSLENALSQDCSQETFSTLLENTSTSTAKKYFSLPSSGSAGKLVNFPVFWFFVWISFALAISAAFCRFVPLVF